MLFLILILHIILHVLNNTVLGRDVDILPHETIVADYQIFLMMHNSILVSKGGGGIWIGRSSHEIAHSTGLCLP